jgi:hypothetical protein
MSYVYNVILAMIEQNPLKLDSTDSSQSYDDPMRKELLWERREEILIYNWSADASLRSSKHDMLAKKNKILYGAMTVPSIIIPIMLGGFTSIIPPQSIVYAICMMFSGVLVGVAAFFNFGKKEQLHHEYAGKFFELTTEISSELSKPKCHRPACDVYLEKIKNKYQSLVTMSPHI